LLQEGSFNDSISVKVHCPMNHFTVNSFLIYTFLRPNEHRNKPEKPEDLIRPILGIFSLAENLILKIFSALCYNVFLITRFRATGGVDMATLYSLMLHRCNICTRLRKRLYWQPSNNHLINKFILDFGGTNSTFTTTTSFLRKRKIILFFSASWFIIWR